MDMLISVLFLFCLIVSICLLGGRGKPLHADTKELVFRIHEYFESEREDSKYGRPLISVTNVWERTYEIDKNCKRFWTLCDSFTSVPLRVQSHRTHMGLGKRLCEKEKY